MTTIIICSIIVICVFLFYKIYNNTLDNNNIFNSMQNDIDFTVNILDKINIEEIYNTDIKYNIQFIKSILSKYKYEEDDFSSK